MKVLCKFHNDTIPSMHIYGLWAYCYVCKTQCPTEELDLPEYAKLIPKKDPTNVIVMLKHIKTLPTQIIRGFKLHYDERGFYIIWPEGNYYKRRNFEGRVRYTAPSGIKPPLFVYGGTSKHLVVIEGELNAMSAYRASWSDYKIVSPGPASDFMRHIRFYNYYQKITLILDHDAAGVVFGCQLKETLLKSGKHCNLVTVKQDFNDTLVKHGEEAVREDFERYMK